MKIPVYRLMSAAQNELVELALNSLAPVLGVSWEFPKGTGSEGLIYLCGLPASRLLDSHTVVGAPVLRETRYGDQPAYFTDVLVRNDRGSLRESPTGSIWAYNDRDSFSGWVAVLDGLQGRDIDPAAFRWVPTGSHANSLKLLLGGKADVTGVDSMIWDHERRSGKASYNQINAIDSFGPWPMPPLMASRDLGVGFLSELSGALPLASDHDVTGLIARWAAVDDSHLDPIVDAARSLRNRVQTL